MPSARTCLHAACLAASLLAAGAAGGEEGAPDGWKIGLGLSGNASSQDASAAGQAPTRPAIDGSQNFLEGISALRLELAAPKLRDLPAEPRVFAHAGVQGWFLFDRSRTLAQEGDFGPLIPGTSNDPQTVGGQGSFVDMQITQGWYAGLGLSFDVPFEPFPFRLKPSFDYYQQTLEFDVAGQSAEILVPGVFFPIPGQPPPPPPAILPVVGSLNVFGSQEETLQAIGPRFELEKDVGSVGPFRVEVFADVAAFFVVSDRHLAIAASGTAGSTRFGVTLGPTIIQGGAGFQLSWLPGTLWRGFR